MPKNPSNEDMNRDKDRYMNLELFERSQITWLHEILKRVSNKQQTIQIQV